MHIMFKCTYKILVYNMYTSECDIDLTKTPPRGYKYNTVVGRSRHPLPFKSSLGQYCLIWQKWSKLHTDVIF